MPWSIRPPPHVPPPPSPSTDHLFLPAHSNPPPPPFSRGWGRGWMEAGYFNDVKDAAGPAVQCIGQRLKKGLESLMAVHYNHTQRSIERTVGSAPGAKQYRRRSKWCLYIYIFACTFRARRLIFILLDTKPLREDQSLERVSR